ncbi:hypothetical protein EVAR_55346_1 [Eumeta japonica]|uniref:Uncharacterized protein n=1 Tax=Eumeta variegata TaxID=151549 RepID=A0A4C1YFL5_EUMVA|nr:hypothetical protein EVAR_55346_1 [Eumeta japonica]
MKGPKFEDDEAVAAVEQKYLGAQAILNATGPREVMDLGNSWAGRLDGAVSFPTLNVIAAGKDSGTSSRKFWGPTRKLLSGGPGVNSELAVNSHPKILKTTWRELRSIERRVCICEVSRKDRCRNSDVRERCGSKEDVVTRVERGTLRWFGRLERMNGSRRTQQIYRANACDEKENCLSPSEAHPAAAAALDGHAHVAFDALG